MKILFFSHYFPPEVNAPATRTFDNCRRWVKKGHRVRVVTCAPNAPEGVVYPGYRNRFSSTEEDGVRVLRVWTLIAPNRGFLRRTLNYVSYMISSFLRALFLEKPDVVIATSPQIFCAIGGCLLSKVRRVPFVLEVRDLWPESIIAVKAMKKGFTIKAFKRIELWLYANSDMIIALSDAFKRAMVKKRVPAEKIKVVTNGVDLDAFTPLERAAARKKLGLSNDKFIVSYIGTLGMAHDLANVLEAANMLKERADILFLIVGGGAEELALRKIAERRSLDNVVFTGRQPKEKIPLFYASSDIILVTLRDTPAFRRVIPSKMFEIMAMRRAYVLAVKGQADEIRKASRSGVFCEPGDPHMMKRCIEYLSRSDDKLERLALNGREYAEKHFSRDRLAEDYIEYLAEVDRPGR
jgi:glycosyltransferase involved in cell wall biosynthesis